MDQENLNQQLLEAVKQGDTGRMWELVEQGADINARGEWGWTALMESAWKGHLTPEFLDAFIEHRTDINARDDDGNTALMESARNGHLTPELLEAFMSHGADINAGDRNGWTALILSARHGHLTPEFLGTFISNGADVNARDKDGNTALMLSARYGHLTPEFLEALISGGADINAGDRNGWTALIWSAYNGHLTPELLKALTSHGADINAQGTWGETALIWAAREGHLTPELLEAFIANGADINIRDKNGHNAMSLCFNLQMAGSLLSFFSCGCSIRNMYDGWTPENFINRVENKENLNAEKRCACALMASLSLYPERNETLDKYVSQKRSAAADVILYGLKNASHGMRENFLSIMSEGRAGALSLSEKNIPVLAGMLLEAMDTNPGLAAEFIRKRVGKKVETWVKEGVEGADILVSRLAHRMRQEEFVSDDAGMPDLDLF